MDVRDALILCRSFLFVEYYRNIGNMVFGDEDVVENRKGSYGVGTYLHIGWRLLRYAGYEAVSQQMNTLFYQGFTEKEQKQFEQYLARILETLVEYLHTSK